MTMVVLLGYLTNNHFFFYNSTSPLTNTLGRIVDKHNALALASK